MMGSINQNNLKQLEQFGNSIRKRDEFLVTHSALKNRKKGKLSKRSAKANIPFKIKKHRFSFFIRSKIKKLHGCLQFTKKNQHQNTYHPVKQIRKNNTGTVRLQERKYQYGSVTILIRRRKRYSMKQQSMLTEQMSSFPSMFPGYEGFYCSSLFDIDILDE
jgi:hypothetical protein